MDGLLLFIGVCILNSLRQLVEYYFSQGLTKPLLTIPLCRKKRAVKEIHNRLGKLLQTGEDGEIAKKYRCMDEKKNPYEYLEDVEEGLH